MNYRLLNLTLLVTLSSAIFAQSSWAQGEPVAYSYNNELNQCLDAYGVSGHNPNFVGECGDLSNQDLTYASLNWGFPWIIKGMVFKNTTLKSATFENAEFTGVDFSGADLSNADFKASVFKRCIFKNANWEKSMLFQTNLEKANLSGADFKEAWLQKVNFKGADLSNADFRNAHLQIANLTNSNLSGANLSETWISGGDLSHSDLSDADLSRTKLFGATLDGADTTGTNFKGSFYDEDTVLPFSEAHGKALGMIFYSNGQPQIPKIYIVGAADGSCSPTEIQLMKNQAVSIRLRGNDKDMFVLKSADLNIDIMSMSGSVGEIKVTPTKSGKYPFSCGVSGSPQVTYGEFIIL
jgi:uncharacterized protein YjbI with pentapeptide repeats